MNKIIKNTLALLTVGALLISAVPVSAQTNKGYTRLYGKDRYATSLEIAKEYKRQTIDKKDKAYRYTTLTMNPEDISGVEYLEGRMSLYEPKHEVKINSDSYSFGRFVIAQGHDLAGAIVGCNRAAMAATPLLLVDGDLNTEASQNALSFMKETKFLQSQVNITSGYSKIDNSWDEYLNSSGKYVALNPEITKELNKQFNGLAVWADKTEYGFVGHRYIEQEESKIGQDLSPMKLSSWVLSDKIRNLRNSVGDYYDVNKPYMDKVFIASADDFPDALVISTLTGASNYGLLLVKGSDKEIPGDVSFDGYLANAYNFKTGKRYATGIPNVVILGGETRVSKEFERQIKSIVDKNGEGGTVTRMVGSDRYDTAAKIYNSYYPNPTKIYIASGNNYADAVPATPLAAITKSPIVIVDSANDSVPAPIEEYLKTLSKPEIVVLGGPGVISDSLANKVISLTNVGNLYENKPNKETNSFNITSNEYVATNSNTMKGYLEELGIQSEVIKVGPESSELPSVYFNKSIVSVGGDNRLEVSGDISDVNNVNNLTVALARKYGASVKMIEIAKTYIQKCQTGGKYYHESKEIDGYKVEAGVGSGYGMTTYWISVSKK